MHDYPQAEWYDYHNLAPIVLTYRRFWWLDLNTFIMEPSYSLQSHIFDNLAQNTYRDINEYNPLNIGHPLNDSWLDEITRSPVGDGKPESINMLLPQDCGGFNLGSFFIRRSAWTDRLLDIWWDPIQYEQRHMQWEHKEQDAFEYLYASQPWIRPHTAFLPQRKACSYPPGACGENNSTIHYNETERDFLVNMAGCEWGRDCWGEMYNYRELSNRLNRTRWEKFKSWLAESAKSTKKRVNGDEKEEKKQEVKKP